MASRASVSVIRAVMPECPEICVKLLGRPLLFARFARFYSQPTRQFLAEPIQLARPVGNLEHRLHGVGAKIFADGVARQADAPLHLANGKALAKVPAADRIEQVKADHSDAFGVSAEGEKSTGQFPVVIFTFPRIIIDDNQK